MEYPRTRRSDVVDVLHGHRIADPYRWLEDPDSSETRAWVQAQNALSRGYLDALPARAPFAELVRPIVLRPTVGAPVYESGWYVVSRGEATSPQNTWYVARTLEELQAGGRVLFDPSSWSQDGSASLNAWSFNPAGTLAAYARSEGGSDWQHVGVIEIETGRVVESDVVVTKFSDLTWLDDTTFCYTRYEDARAEGTATDALPRPLLYGHTVGTDPTNDHLLLEFPDDPQASMWPQRSSDDRWLTVLVNRGTEARYRLWAYRIGEDGQPVGPLRVVDAYAHDISVVDVVDDTLYLITDEGAPRGTLVSLPLPSPGAEDGDADADLTAAARRTVVPESDNTLTGAVIAGGVVVTEHLVDASPRLTRWTLDGRRLGELDVTGGMLVAWSGAPGRDELLVTLNSVTSPVDSHVVTPSTGETRPLSLLLGEAWTAPEVTVTRLRATSLDGTSVPYWLVRRADAGPGPLPTLMYGYGGFDVPMTASFSPLHIAWIEAGGAVAIATLRGGGEFGRSWYEQGRREHKQNVFDDFAAVAHHLLDSGATTRDQLAAWGGSNGGLLVGALLTQHPDLVAAAVPVVGVLDVLRFHRFTIGSAWISDYGDPDVAADFEVALAYSPLHRITDGTDYPATLVVTGDHDDRVVPAHSHKFTATLQRAQAGPAPVLTRIETATGHGAGKSKAVLAAEITDILAFLAEHTGLTPRA